MVNSSIHAADVAEHMTEWISGQFVLLAMPKGSRSLVRATNTISPVGSLFRKLGNNVTA